MKSDIKLLAFDLDGTLTESGVGVHEVVIHMLRSLQKIYNLALIGGGSYSTISTQFFLTHDLPFRYIASLSGNIIHESNLTLRNIPFDAYNKIPLTHKLQSIKELYTYGGNLEDRGNQLTVKLLGSNASLKDKYAWDKHHKNVRYTLIRKLRKQFPLLSITAGGLTSIDISPQNKGDAMEFLLKYLHLKPEQVIYFGDRFDKYGNDHSLLKTGVKCVNVKGWKDTIKKLVKYL